MQKRKKSKVKPPKGYDSMLEFNLHKDKLKNWEYHPSETVEYTVPHYYEPDFVLESGRKVFLLEVKGRFRERKEASKYVYIQKACQEEGYKGHEEAEVIFLFQDSRKPMPHAQRRKDGTRQTHGEWAEKNGFRYGCVAKGDYDVLSSS